MPVIDIQGPDGKVVEVIHRNGDPLPQGFKKLFPTRISVTGLRSESTTAEKVKKGYYKLECREGSRFRSMFTKQQIKKTWNF